MALHRESFYGCSVCLHLECDPRYRRALHSPEVRHREMRVRALQQPLRGDAGFPAKAVSAGQTINCDSMITVIGYEFETSALRWLNFCTAIEICLFHFIGYFSHEFD